jgi:hypothetical protein
MGRWFLLLALLSLPGVPAAQTIQTDGSQATLSTMSKVFDTPVSTERIVFKVRRGEPIAKRELTCFHFAELRVRQLDLGEVGAAELAILPYGANAKRVACRQKRETAEIIISGSKWSGYFKGAKAGFAFFDAEDGTNGGLGFAVFDGRTGAKLFEDLAAGEIRAADPIEDGIRLRYTRAFVGKCSVPVEGSGCWSEIVKQMPGVSAERIPDCAAGYLNAKSEMAHDRCEAHRDQSEACLQSQMKLLDEQQWDKSPSVLGYEVEALITRSRQSVAAVGGQLSCWPAD